MRHTAGRCCNASCAPSRRASSQLRRRARRRQAAAPSQSQTCAFAPSQQQRRRRVRTGGCSTTPHSCARADQPGVTEERESVSQQAPAAGDCKSATASLCDAPPLQTRETPPISPMQGRAARAARGRGRCPPSRQAQAMQRERMCCNNAKKARSNSAPPPAAAPQACTPLRASCDERKTPRRRCTSVLLARQAAAQLKQAC